MSEKTTKEIKLYELGFHLVSTISEDKVAEKVDEIKAILAKNNAEIVKEGETKLMNLAYEVIKHVSGKNQKFTNSYFGWFKFNATAEAIKDIKKAVDSMEEILRSLIIKTVNDDEHSTSKIVDEDSHQEVNKKDEPEISEPKEEVSSDNLDKESKTTGAEKTE